MKLLKIFRRKEIKNIFCKRFENIEGLFVVSFKKKRKDNKYLFIILN